MLRSATPVCADAAGFFVLLSHHEDASDKWTPEEQWEEKREQFLFHVTVPLSRGEKKAFYARQRGPRKTWVICFL